METIVIHDLVYEVYDHIPEGCSPDRWAGAPRGKYMLYRNHQPRYISLLGKIIPNPAFRRALIRT